MSRDWDFSVKGYAGRRNPPVGALLVHTTHMGEASRDMTVEAWRTRAARGECSRVENIDHRTLTMETINFPEAKTRARRLDINGDPTR